MTNLATLRRLGLLFAVSLMAACGSGGGGGAPTTPGPAPGSPSITTQPAAQTVTDGNSASFSVAATGSGTLSYQWKRNGANISGATAASYSTPALALSDSGTDFSVDVSNANGTTSSNSARVTVQAVAPAIVSAPANVTVATGQAAEFSVIAIGSATLQYQWQRNGADIPGATGATYTLPSAASGDNGASFRVVVSNSAGSATSSAATLTVAPPGAPVLVSFTQLIAAGAGQAFAISATLSSGVPPFTYQWLRDGTPIPGASGTTSSTQISYTTPELQAADNGVRYRIEVSNANGSSSGNEVLFSVIGAPALVGGESHSIAMTDGGNVYAWGDNTAGQLGLGDNSARLAPVQVASLSGIVGVAAGRAHSLALRNDGSVVAWGANGEGQLGVGTQTSHNTPQAVSGLTNVKAIAAAGDQSFALRTDGTVWAWGDNAFGQLGDGSNSDRLSPVQVSSLNGITVISVAAGPAHTLAVDKQGRVWAWGDNGAGQHGDTALASRNTPVQVSGVSGIAGAAAGAGFSVALSYSTRVWTWGRNDKGQLGDGGTAGRPTPQQLTTMSGGGAMPMVLRIGAGSEHVMALPFIGSPLAWGSNAAGQLGNGTTGGSRTAPGLLTSAPSGVRALGTGTAHSLLRAGTGAVYAWGDNAAGQIGNGASGSAVTQPVPASALSLN